MMRTPARLLPRAASTSRWEWSPLVCALLACALVACASERAATEEASGLPPGVVARVGSELVRGDELEAVAAAPGSERAVDVVTDTLLSVEARLREPHLASVVERAVLARAQRESIRRDLRASAPPSDADIRRALESNWLLYDRPRAVRALVVRLVVPELGRDEPYRLEANRIADECAGLTFASAIVDCVAEGTPRGEILRLPPIDEKGRSVPLHASDRSLMVPAANMAKEIGRLERPGSTTSVHPGHDDYQVAIALDVILADPFDTAEEKEALIAGILSPEVARRADAIVAEGNSRVERTKKDQAALLRLVWRQ